MFDRLGLGHVIAGALVLLAPLFAVGWMTRSDPSARPPVEIVGGGFIFNYRIAEVHYGFTALVTRPLESGSVIEAHFEDPAGGAALVVRERISPRTTQYTLRSPPVRGVEAGRPYEVSVRVLDRLETSEIWSRTLSYRSDVSDAAMPRAPLTVGPGYHRNPAAEPPPGG